MRTKSPLRTRRIRNGALVGAFVGAMIGLVGTRMTGRLWYIPFFALVACIMAAASTALMQSDYDFD